MNLYYRMTTAQKDAVPLENLNCEPFSNLQKSEWIVESSTPGLESITQFPSVAECRMYIIENVKDWDDLYEV